MPSRPRASPARGDAAGDPLGYGDQLQRVTKAVHSVRRAIEQSAGVDRARFVRWLTRALLHHLEGPGIPTA